MEYIIKKENDADELMHYGVLGMKWGHRKANYTSSQARADRARSEASTARKLASKYTNAMDNKAARRQLQSDIKQTRIENKALRKEAKKQSYGHSIKKTIGRDIGILGTTTIAGTALGLAGHEKAMNTVAKIGGYAMDASNIAGAVDLGRTFLRRNGL